MMHQPAMRTTSFRSSHPRALNAGFGAAALALLLIGCPEDSTGDECGTRADCELGERCLDGTCAPDLPRADGGDARDSGAVDDGGTAGDGGPEADGGCTGAGCDPLPAHRWTEVLDGGAGFEAGRTIAVDGDGNVVVAGPFNGTLSVLGVAHTSRGESDIFVAKFNPAGEIVWMRSFGSVLADSCRGVAVDAAGNVYLTGQYQGDDVRLVPSADPLAYTAGDSKNYFIARFNSDGTYAWSHGYAGPGIDTGNDIAVQGSRVYAVGRFAETMVGFPGGTVTAAGTNTDAFIAVYDLDGIPQWQHTYGGTQTEGAWGVAVTDNDKAHITGIFSGTVNFGTAPGTEWERTAVGQSLFVLKLSADGEPRRLYTAGGAGASFVGRDLAIAPDRGLVVGGNFSGSVTFSDGGAMVTSTDTDGFLLRLDNMLVPRWHEVLGGPGRERVLNVAYGAGEQVFATGQFADTSTIAGESFTAVGADDAFVAAFQEDATGTSITPGWARAFGSAGQDWGWGTAVHGDRLFVSGAVRGPVDFGGGERAAMSDGDIYVTAYRVR